MIWMEAVIFEEIHFVVEGDKVIHIRDASGTVVALKLHVQLPESAKHYIAKSDGGQWA